jgi:uncharacterized protein (TIGR02145 family)
MSHSEQEETGLVHVGSVGLTKVQHALRLTDQLVNSFETVVVGDQEWMVRNLNVSHFRNGDPLPEIRDPKEWEIAGKEGKPAWCYNDNDPQRGKVCGKLYNWHTISDSRGIAPKGWRIPSKYDWEVLYSKLDLVNMTDSKDEAEGKYYWLSSGKTRILESVLKLNLSGSRSIIADGEFYSSNCFLWSSTQFDQQSATVFIVNEKMNGAVGARYHKGNGFSIRCIKVMEDE